MNAFRNKLNSAWRRLSPPSSDRQRREVWRIIEDTRPPDTSEAESAFDVLQKSYPSNRGDLYKYDAPSLMERAVRRAAGLLHLAERLGKSPLRILDAGAGDGVLGAVLRECGHDVVLVDSEDWRRESGCEIPLVVADLCGCVPIEDEAFDMVVSFNSFEHFPEPSKALAHLIRATKQGGVLHFDYGPLYCSPWGMHAQRTLFMPYPQFLFSEAFIEAKLEELGIDDLGVKRTTLQYMNKWKRRDYADLWNGSGCEVLDCLWRYDRQELGIVSRFPSSFHGRGLALEDLVIASNSVTLRKRKL